MYTGGLHARVLHLEQLLDPGLTEHTPEAPDLAGVTGHARLEVLLAAEELPYAVLVHRQPRRGGGAKHVGVQLHAAHARLACKQRGRGLADLGPRHPCGQHGQRVAQVDHGVQPGAKEVGRAHLFRSSKLPETERH